MTSLVDDLERSIAAARRGLFTPAEALAALQAKGHPLFTKRAQAERADVHAVWVARRALRLALIAAVASTYTVARPDAIAARLVRQLDREG